MSQEKHKPHVTETPDTSHIKNIDVTHEASDVQVEGIVKFIIGLSILTIVTFIALLGLFMVFQKTATQGEQQTHRSPIAMSGEERLPPEPRLQGAPGFAKSLETAKKEEANGPKQISGLFPPKEPMWEIKALKDQWKYVLENGPTDANGQRFGMPIEQAKAEVLKQMATRKQ
jgi:hypothetical protein